MMFNDPRIVSAVSSGLNNMSLICGDRTDALKNREHFLKGLGIDYRHLICGKQVHGSSVRLVRQDDRGRGSCSFEDAFSETDAFITDKRLVPVAIFTADCLSIFIFDEATPAIGLVHAGWRSTKSEIAIKTVAMMEKTFNSKIKDLRVAFGPSIRGCCYEVQGEFFNHFSYGLIKRKEKYFLDLAAINRKQLCDLGLADKHIADSDVCTYCRSSDFFSYRAQGDSCGRMMSVAMLT